jgi:hypothetical protein
LALVQTIHDLNHGKVPASFARTHRGLRELIATRRFTLVPITETKDRDQNGMVWIKVEPVDIFPYPLTTMRGLPTTRDEVSMGRVDAERLAQRCDEKSRPAPGKD